MSSIPNQVGPTPGAMPYSNQQNFGQMIGEVSSFCSHAPIPVIANLINNAVRAFYDRRNWYGLFVRGQIQTSGYFSTGTVTLTQGSTTVQGNGTNWTSNINGLPIIGQQLRIGFTSPILTVVGANLSASPQTLTLEMPWSMPSATATGYFIAKYIFSFPNIRYFYSVRNLQMMYRMICNVPQSLLDNWDPARLVMLYPRVVATCPPDSLGNMAVEIWPCASSPQALPYIAVTLPPNLVNDDDNLPAFMRCDIIKSHAIANALLYRPKANTNYSESMCLQVSSQKMKEFEYEISRAEQMDEGILRQDIITVAEQAPYANIDWASGNLLGGGFYAAMSATSAYSEDY